MAFLNVLVVVCLGYVALLFSVAFLADRHTRRGNAPWLGSPMVYTLSLSIYCTAWTLAGLPCLTLPLLVGASGLPVGVQMIGGIEEDDRLMRTAAWVQRALAEEE